MTNLLSEEDMKILGKVTAVPELYNYILNMQTLEEKFIRPGNFPKVVFIPGRLPGANEYINACRADSRKGNEMKRDAQMLCLCGLHKLPRHNAGRVGIKFIWVEPNKNRDPDNIAFAKKFILDQMQTMQIISGDGWRQIAFLQDEFRVDRQNPGVEIHLYIIEE